MFALFFAVNVPGIAAVKIPYSRLMGALTYPLYLVHAHIGYMALSRYATDSNKLKVYPLVVCGVVAIAYAIHALVERRLASVWKRLFANTLGRAVDTVSRGMSCAMAKSLDVVAPGIRAVSVSLAGARSGTGVESAVGGATLPHGSESQH
jgi:peptidoglycan/LPS O-acetylase OafA/YrhL